MPTNPNDQAYPLDSTASGGLTKRELIAAMAMQGFISNSRYSASGAEHARISVAYADRLIDALNTTKPS